MDYITLNDGNKYGIRDGDSIEDEAGNGKRIRGFDTYETYHPGHLESAFTATNSGEFQTKLLKKLMEERGFTGINYTGETDSRSDKGAKRDVVDIYNPETNETLADLLYYEGLVDLRAGGGPTAGDRIDEKHRRLYLQGKRARANGQTNDYYDELRTQFIEAKKQDDNFIKDIAPTEQFFDARYNRSAYLRHSDRDIYNHADNVLKSSFSGGVDSLQAGFWGFVEMLGYKAGFNHIQDVGASRREFNEYQISDLPEWTNQIHDVDNFDDFSEWFTGALGGSAPFFAMMAAGFIPGMQGLSFGSMALVYTGMTVNDMEGDISQKSFKHAIAAGLAMSTFERLGGSAMFGKAFKTSALGKPEAVKQMKQIYMDKNKMSKEEVDKIFSQASKEEMVMMMSDIKRNDVIWKIYAKSVAGRIGVGALRETVTEAAQEGTQYTMAYWGSAEGEGKFDKEEFRKLLENSAAAGFALGGTVGGTMATFGESSPISLNVRQRVWEATKNSKYDTTDPLDMAAIINSSSQRNIHRRLLGKSENDMTREALQKIIETSKDPETVRKTKEALKRLNFNEGGGQSSSANVSINEAIARARAENISFEDAFSIDSNVEANDAEVKKMLEQQKEQEKAKPKLNKAGEVIKDNKLFSSGYNVLKRRMGDAWKRSKVLSAEMSFSGFIHDRVAYGQNHVQNRRTFEGRQHDILHRIIQELRIGLGISGDRHSNRSKAYDELREYVLKQDEIRNSGKGAINDEWANWLDSKGYDADKQRAFERAKSRVINEYEAEQAEIYKTANPKYKGKKDLHTFRDRKVSNALAMLDKKGFIAALKSRGYTDEEAELEMQQIEGTPGGYDYTEFANTSFLTKKPIGLKKKGKYNANDENFKEFWEENSYDSAILRATEIAHYTSDTIATGFGGDRLNSRILSIRQELTDTMGKEYADKWMPEIASTIYNHYLAHRGELHKIDNDNLRAAFSNAGAMMALAYMPLAVFSSIPEIGLAFLGADKEMFLKAVAKAADMGKDGIVEQLRKIADSDISDSEREFALEVMRRRGMLTHEYGAGHVIDAEVGNDRRNWLQRKVMPGFYKITGLTSFTTAMRMIRESIGNDYIASAMGTLEQALYGGGFDSFGRPIPERDPKTFGINDSAAFNNKEARAFEKLKELGGDPRQVVIENIELEADYRKWQDSELERISSKVESGLPYPEFKQDMEKATQKYPEWLLRTNHNYNDPLSARALQLSRTLDMMRSNFVDAALVNPDPGKRPLFYSDGRVRLLVLFQGYLSVFSSQIIYPIMKNLAGKGSPKEQVNAAGVMMGTIALGFLGQAIKDEFKYGDKPSWLTDAEYFQRGVQASGLMGQYERPFNMFFPLYGSEADTIADRAWGELGALSSTVDSAFKSLEYGLEGEGEKALNKLFKITPGIGVFTSGRQKLAGAISDLGD